MNRVHLLVFGGVLWMGSVGMPVVSMGQGPADAGPPRFQALPQPPGRGTGGTTSGAVATFSDQKVKPLTEGPLHEAFLSPRKDRNPERADKAPPPPLTERPGIDPPSTTAEWIEGYWEWDSGRSDRA